MAYKKTRQILLGSKMTKTAWGRLGMSRGMYSGGYTIWMYGIKGLIGIKIFERWGDYYNMK